MTHFYSHRRSLAITAAVAIVAAAVACPAVAAEQPAVEHLNGDQRCLALAMYWEARNEGSVGMRAVGSVVLNRVESDDFPDTPCDVIHQGGETPPCQFSWWCDGRSDAPRDSKRWQAAVGLAAEMLRTRGVDPTGGALFFHSAAIPVPWRVERVRTARILGHIYYR